jgi:hypothetical protein
MLLNRPDPTLAPPNPAPAPAAFALIPSELPCLLTGALATSLPSPYRSAADLEGEIFWNIVRWRSASSSRARWAWAARRRFWVWAETWRLEASLGGASGWLAWTAVVVGGGWAGPLPIVKDFFDLAFGRGGGGGT